MSLSLFSAIASFGSLTISQSAALCIIVPAHTRFCSMNMILIQQSPCLDGLLDDKHCISQHLADEMQQQQPHSCTAKGWSAVAHTNWASTPHILPVPVSMN